MSQWLALISFRYTAVPEWMALIFSNQRHPRRSFDTTHTQVVWMPLGWYHSCSYGMTLHSARKRLPQIGWLLWSLQFNQKKHSKTQSDLSFRNRYEFMRIRKDYLIIWNLDYRLKLDKYIIVYVMYVLYVCVLMIHDICYVCAHDTWHMCFHYNTECQRI